MRKKTMANGNSKTVKRTEVEVERDQITVRTDLDVPKKYPSLPIFAGQGWISATVVGMTPPDVTYRIEDDETGATLTFTDTPAGRKEMLPPNHHAEAKYGNTYAYGDFLIDYRNNRGTDQLRVRIHPDITDPDPKVVVESLSDEEGGDE